MQVAPSIMHRHSLVDTPMTPPSSQEKPLDDAPCSVDVSQHLTSLKTRLDFACFKLHHGWENSTLIDVELMWKKKQRQMYSEIPTPRITQQDILDKRSQVPSARTNKAKRARLTRTMSAPSPPPAHHTYKKRKSHQPLLLSSPQQQQQQLLQSPPQTQPSFSSPSPPQHILSSPPSFSSRPVEIRPRLIQPRPPRDPYRFYQHPHDKEEVLTVEDDEEEDEEEGEEDSMSLQQKKQRMDMEEEEGLGIRKRDTIEQPKSSLDFLSYAIAMKEGQDHPPLQSDLPIDNEQEGNSSNKNNNDNNNSQERTTLLKRPDWDGRTQKKPASAFHSVTNDDRFSGGETDSDEPSPPSSPVAAAAHAIMMFVHDHYSRNNKHT